MEEIPKEQSDLKVELDMADCILDAGDSDPNMLADYENGFTPLVMLLADKEVCSNPLHEEKINRVVEFFISRGAGLYALDKVKEKIEIQLSKFSRKSILQVLLENSMQNGSNARIDTHSSRKLKVSHETEEKFSCGCFTYCK